MTATTPFLETAAPDCFSCHHQAQAERPPREDIVHTEHWRVAHAFNSTLPGWLVLNPTTHLTSFDQLSEEAALEMGSFVRRLSLALKDVTGCVKTYVMQFSEAEGFSHLHIHVVPRGADHPDDARGPHVFAFLSDDESEWLPEAKRDDLALQLRAALQRVAAS